jgi:hypothetical protein
MFRRKHASHFDSNDADQREAKVILKISPYHKFMELLEYNMHGLKVQYTASLSISHTITTNEQINELKAALGPLSTRDEKYCSVACLARYLEARNWNVAKARKMLEESLKWRAAYRPEDIRWVNLLFCLSDSVFLIP